LVVVKARADGVRPRFLISKSRYNVKNKTLLNACAKKRLRFAAANIIFGIHGAMSCHQHARGIDFIF